MKRQALFFTVSLLIAGAVSATTELNKTLKKFGVNGDTAYFNVEGGLADGGCANALVYLTTNNVFGKFAYAHLLTAKVSNTEVSRIDYARNASNFCVLTLVEIE